MNNAQSTVRNLQFEVTRLDLRAGVAVHEFIVTFGHRATWFPPADESAGEPLLLTGTVRAGGSLLWLGHLSPAAATLRTYPSPTQVSLSLTDDQVSVLGQSPSGDVELLFDLDATMLGANEGQPASRTQVRHRIPAAEWSDLLERLGTAVTVSIRVPAPLGPIEEVAEPGEASLTGIAAHLRRARAQLRDRQWRLAAVSCRSALEELRRLDDLPYLVPDAKLRQLAPVNREEHQRWAAQYYALLGLAHGAAHPLDTAGRMQWTRTSAEALVASTAALVVYYTSDDRPRIPPVDRQSAEGS